MQDHYLSWESQNEFIQIYGQLVKSKIDQEVNNGICNCLSNNLHCLHQN